MYESLFYMIQRGAIEKFFARSCASVKFVVRRSVSVDRFVDCCANKFVVRRSASVDRFVDCCVNFGLVRLFAQKGAKDDRIHPRCDSALRSPPN